MYLKILNQVCIFYDITTVLYFKIGLDAHYKVVVNSTRWYHVMQYKIHSFNYFV